MLQFRAESALGSFPMKLNGRVTTGVVLLWVTTCHIAISPAFADDWLTQPVDDKTFESYLQFFAYDRHVPFELRVLDVKQEAGLTKEHLSFQSTPAVRVFANLYRPITTGSGKPPAFILLHGG